MKHCLTRSSRSANWVEPRHWSEVGADETSSSENESEADRREYHRLVGTETSSFNQIDGFSDKEESAGDWEVISPFVRVFLSTSCSTFNLKESVYEVCFLFWTDDAMLSSKRQVRNRASSQLYKPDMSNAQSVEKLSDLYSGLVFCDPRRCCYCVTVTSVRACLP